MTLRAEADVEEAKADLEYKQTKADRARRLQSKNMSVSTEEMQQADLRRRHGRRRTSPRWRHRQAPAVAGPRDRGGDPRT